MGMIMDMIAYNGWKLLYRLPCQGLIFFGLALAWVGMFIGSGWRDANEFWFHAS